ncbi:hypothetical protein ElyMa_002928600 [Elysia marginata]|uniref:Uncharacterized protein n=1 Tax=Elysia marginata TaxID=1093978 RepID=A0AAV4I7W9_9GAST|nr:hypothetical protein ElyMa_002928600 [Elysia marginata]
MKRLESGLPLQELNSASGELGKLPPLCRRAGPMISNQWKSREAILLDWAAGVTPNAARPGQANVFLDHVTLQPGNLSWRTWKVRPGPRYRGFPISQQVQWLWTSV